MYKHVCLRLHNGLHASDTERGLIAQRKQSNNNSVEEIEFSYNAETDEVEEKVVNSTPIEEN